MSDELIRERDFFRAKMQELVLTRWEHVGACNQDFLKHKDAPP